MTMPLANVMFYGLFVVFPGLLLIIGLSFYWFNLSTRGLVKAALQSAKPWSPGRWIFQVWLPLLPRVGAAFTAIALLARELNDPVEDGPLGPFSDALPAILVWSLSVATLYTLSHFIGNWRKSGKALAADDSAAAEANQSP